MQPLRLPVSTDQYDYVELKGGLDLLTPTLRLPSGRLRDAVNFEQSITGGYSTIAGYERYSGQPAPSLAEYLVLTIGVLTAVNAGNTVVGSVSGATGIVISASGSLMSYTKATGVFLDGETLLVGGVAAAIVLRLGGVDPTPGWSDLQRAAAADIYRADIGPVPGSGPIRGVANLNGVRYAWRNSAAGSALLLYRSAPSGWALVTTPTLLPSGRVETDIGNFGQGPRLYGCDGMNKGFEFDGATYTQITTGQVVDRPNHVQVHKGHLFFSFGTNLAHSSIASVSNLNPQYNWTVAAGAAQYAFSSTIHCLLRQSGDQTTGAMLIGLEDSTKILYGSSAADFQPVDFEESAGCKPFSAQRLGGQTLLFSELGVLSVSATQAFGNFAPSSLTLAIRPFTQARRNNATASLVNREKSQYRVFFNDGSGLYTTVVNGKLLGVLPTQFPNRVMCACRGDSSIEGSETAFFGSDNGFVYQLDSGTSHDGLPINAYFTLTFANQGNAQIAKNYRSASFEIQGSSYAEFRMTYEIGYGSSELSQGQEGGSVALNLAPTYWDAFSWDSFVWDGRTLAPSAVSLDGTAENIALRVDVASRAWQPFTINSVVLRYKQRRALRGVGA